MPAMGHLVLIDELALSANWSRSRREHYLPESSRSI
jgi:hypothetical protein